jgi:hypothetical protein
MAKGHFNKNWGKKIILLGIIILFVLLSWQVFAQKELEVKYPSIPGAEKPETTTTPIPSLLKYIYNLSILLTGLLALVLLIWGGIRYTISTNNPGRMADAREQITAALLGMIIVFASYLVLNTINPELLILRVIPLETIEVTPYSPPEHLDAPEYEFQEIPVGTLITSEIDASSFVTTDELDLSWDSEEYDDAFSETITYSTNYQGALYGRRLKRIHEVASTTVPIIDMLETISSELMDLIEELGDAATELKDLALECNCSECDAGECTGNHSCIHNCLCEGDPCPHRKRMEKLRKQIIPSFYEDDDSPIPCRMVEFEYFAGAFESFLDAPEKLVKNEDYEDQSYWHTGTGPYNGDSVDDLRNQIEDCIREGNIEQDQYDQIEDLIDLMAEVENKGTLFLDTDPPERDVETNIIHLERLLSFLDHSKSMLNPFSQIGCQPQALSFHQRGQFQENYGVALIPSQFEDVEVVKDPATFYCPKQALPQTSTRNQNHRIVLAQEAETFELPIGQIQTTCSPIVEIPIGKTIDQAIQLIEDILRELGEPDNPFGQGIWNKGHFAIDEIEEVAKEGGLAKLMFGSADQLIEVTSEDSCVMCEEACEASYIETYRTEEIKDDEGNVIGTEQHCECECICEGEPCPTGKIEDAWGGVMDMKLKIKNKCQSVAQVKESMFQSFYKLNSENPEEEKEEDRRMPIGEDSCCNEESGVCRNEDGSIDDDKMEKRDYTLIEKLVEVQKLLNRSRDFATYQLLIEELIDLDPGLASWDEVDEIDNEHRVSLTTCQGLYAQLRERERKEVSRKILENCWTARRFEHINTEFCGSDPPYDCDFFDPLFPLKRSSILCYCFHEDTYPEVASDFFCCSVTQ